MSALLTYRDELYLRDHSEPEVQRLLRAYDSAQTRLSSATELLERVGCCYADNEEAEDLIRDTHAFLSAATAAGTDPVTDLERFESLTKPPSPTLLERIEAECGEDSESRGGSLHRLRRIAEMVRTDRGAR